MATVGKKTQIEASMKYPAPTGWMGLPPWPQILLGILMIGGAIAHFIINWLAGYITVFSFILFTLGAVSLALGIDTIRQKRIVDREMAIVRDRFNELVDGVADLQRRGEDPLPWLGEQGLTNGVIRFRLIKYAKEQEKKA